MAHPDSFGSKRRLDVDGTGYTIFSLEALRDRGFPGVDRLPFSLKILLENLLRLEDGRAVTAEDIAALAGWQPNSGADREIAFTPARVLLQDFTGVPVVVDLASMRDAIVALGGDPARINPLQRVDLVIDHSVQVDYYGRPDAFEKNVELEFERNRERYQFLRWGQQAFRNFRVVPPGTGIVHQVNLEYLASVVFQNEVDGELQAYPDTLVGTDSHTTMINGLGVLGWGVGGIEAEAAMLGQPVAMLIPEVVGFRLTGRLREGATGTDLVLRVTQMLRERGVVGKFVEFYGTGLTGLPLAARATIANMAPEYGATMGFFPVDDETLAYLRFTGRDERLVRLVEAYCKAQGLFRTDETPDPVFSETLELDLGDVEPSIAGPRRPQDRVPLRLAKADWEKNLAAMVPPEKRSARAAVRNGTSFELRHGSVVIAAITSCTNTSNPEVMLGAGLLARKAVERGLATPPWVKTSLAPGSQVVTEYLAEAGLTPYLDRLGFELVGYGCTTCIGNSGPLPEAISREIAQRGLVVCSVLSGNRNFEGRIHSEVRANYLMSPPLVVAYALAGRMDVDLVSEPLGIGGDGRPVFLRDIWPTPEEVEQAIAAAVRPEMFREVYRDVYRGDERWAALPVPAGARYAWDPASTYIKRPPYFDGMSRQAPAVVSDIRGARVLALLGDAVTTDHISPAGSIRADSPAGRWLIAHGVAPADFNSYGARRGNHEVMVRGTFANVRLRNRLAPGTEGGFTTHLPSGEVLPIYDAAIRYQAEGVPLLVLAGKEYGSGSSRDWAAKGPRLLGVRAVIAESFERIHRSNLVGMGILPLQFPPGRSAASLGLTGREVFDVLGVEAAVAAAGRSRTQVRVTARGEDGRRGEFDALVRIDTPAEAAYYRHGDILSYVVRSLLAGEARPPLAPAAGAPVPERTAVHDGLVEEGSIASFPASDPPAY
ncbi:MAG: aconitate hydratase AcnA [Dehalococcoidia bacterium]|nr:aconitate hydratase AcnA [Dehalococcoidia bacterium]